MEVNFFILLPPDINSKVAKNAQRVARLHPHRFIVDSKKFSPHITLFGATVNKNKLNFVLSKLTVFLEGVKAFPVRTDGYSSDKGGFLVLNIKPRRELEKFRKRLGTETKRYAKKIRPPRLPYSPHVTLTRFKEPGFALQMSRNQSALSTTFKLETIGVGLKDDQGQVYKILKTMSLKQK
jgi:2'-5' RNA ligase